MYFFFVTSQLECCCRLFFGGGVRCHISIAKEESFVIGFSSFDSKTMKLTKEVVTPSLSASGWGLLINLCGGYKIFLNVH